jgi:hypothetical protein
MKDIFSAFQADVFRPIVSLLIPGAIATSSWFVALLWKYPTLQTLVAANHTETIFLLLLAMLGLGLICENLGSRIEILYDGLAREQDGEFDSVWFSYLRTAFVAEPIGQRYLRTTVLRLKFELGSCVGIAIADAGVLWLWQLALPWQRALTMLGGSVFLIGYFIWESWATHGLLAQTRRELLKPISVIK